MGLSCPQQATSVDPNTNGHTACDEIWPRKMTAHAKRPRLIHGTERKVIHSFSKLTIQLYSARRMEHGAWILSANHAEDGPEDRVTFVTQYLEPDSDASDGEG